MNIREILSLNPIIAAVNSERLLEEASESEIEVVFVLYGTILTIPGIVETLKEKGKTAILNLSERFSDGCASDAVKSILEMSGSVPIRMYSAITLTTRLTRLPNRQITSLCCTSPR